MVERAGGVRVGLAGWAVAVLLALGGCGGGGGGAGTSEGPSDPLALNVGPADADGIVAINVTGLPPHASALPASAFRVVESGSDKTVVFADRIGDGATRSEADLAFVLDTTGSMRVGLDSVKQSIIDFVDHLDRRGLDLRLGAVTFGDAFDTRREDGGGSGVSITGRTPPAFDTDERPSLPLTPDVAAFKAFVAEQQPRDGSGSRSPENALGALALAYEQLAWRPGAQRMLIVVTDSCSYDERSYAVDGITGAWIPPTAASALAGMRGQAVVHVIAPAQAVAVCKAAGYMDMAFFTGPTGTGGVAVDWAAEQAFDLTTLPIADAATRGYLIKYATGARGPRVVRVIVDDGAGLRAEASVTVDP